jgi:hypothetical protein
VAIVTVALRVASHTGLRSTLGEPAVPFDEVAAVVLGFVVTAEVSLGEGVAGAATLVTIETE